MAQSQFAKAIIRPLEGDAPPVECMFNPKEYTIAKKVKWSAPPAKGGDLGEYEFGGGEPSNMTLQLLFDTFEDRKDVRDHTHKLWQLMLVNPKLKDKKSGKGRPPQVQFQWGESFSFEAVITSITQKFTLFLENGIPVRATLDVGFQQTTDEKYKPKQNPTSGGIGGGHQWTVKEGDTLASIAYSEYGDSNSWRPIADVNRLTQVRRLRPGIVLEIPNLA